MKPKMHQQIHPRDTFPPHHKQAHVGRQEVQEEIRNFLQALDSYAARAAKDPRISFQQHLGSFFAACVDDDRHVDRH